MKTARPLLLILVLAFFSVAVYPAIAAERLPTGLPLVAAAEADIDPAPLAQLSERMQAFVDQQEISGAVWLVAQQGRVVSLEAVGLADLETKRPMRPDTLFCIASMTKPITATALMILQDEGKLSVVDPLARYVPEFQDAATAEGKTVPITLKHLLTHTSGLGGSQENQGTLEQTAQALARQKLAFEPGTRWQYSPGLSVIGRVVEVASGQPFEQFLQERIFAPLEMADTTFHPTAEQQQRLARLYQRGEKDNSLEPTTHWLVHVAPEKSPNPSGGLFSTAPDMARFYQMVLNGGELNGRRIVSAAAVRQMTAVQTDDLKTGFTDGNGWGLGWCIVRQPQGITRMLSPGTFGHGGAFGTQGWVDPQRQMVFVLMIQRIGLSNSDGSAMREALQEYAVQAIAKK
jgi:CubicO group peptidase (beta-lactamase class C family)